MCAGYLSLPLFGDYVVMCVSAVTVYLRLKLAVFLFTGRIMIVISCKWLVLYFRIITSCSLPDHPLNVVVYSRKVLSVNLLVNYLLTWFQNEAIASLLSSYSLCLMERAK